MTIYKSSHQKKYLCGIIGYPLNKPRSIPIWQKYFKKKNINALMVPFEINPKLFNKFVKNLRKNSDFVAMAVTMPYKKKIINHMDELDEFAKKTQSVNLVVKKNKQLIGYNTDIYGAHRSFKENIQNFSNVIIIGLGGTGQAIFNYLFKTYKNFFFTLISSKYIFKAKNVKILKNLNKDILKKKSYIINCTPLGSDLSKELLHKSPIEKNLFQKISKKTHIFDIIYSPKKNILSSLCKAKKINYMNGLKMNTLQAKQALNITFKNFDQGNKLKKF
tara:strand:- start:81 stop:905 length:825 start_codon:yes stop_codon:yes gene_type:complete